MSDRFERPKLTVIENHDPEPQREWLKFPETVNARSPFDKNERCSFRISTVDLLKQAKSARRQPIYELWANILGKPPPVKCQVDPPENLTTLWEAHACWQGIERPSGHDSNGDNFIAYCIEAKTTYRLISKAPATFARLRNIPNNVCFMVFARLDVPADHYVKGVLTHWQFVQIDVSNPRMPLGYGERFAKRLW